jgi:hypothetical protein
MRVSLPLAGFSLLVAFILSSAAPVHAQTGGKYEPVRYIGGVSINPAPHDGGLRPPIGVANQQVFRANRTHPELADGFGWTYNHAPMLAYWNGKFYLEYISNPVDEHIAPGHTLLTTSADGRVWTKPQVIFPEYQPPPKTPMPEGCEGYMMHQRMGFYVAPNGRLLASGFYGHAEDPFKEGGIGRVVREIHRDGSFGPIHFIRYTRHADWNESNTSYPFYKHSTDAGFVEACESLLLNKLMTLQWKDEDPGPIGFYPVDEEVEALSFYHRKDNKVTALWKWSMAALSEDEGATFSRPIKCQTLTMDGGKVWGQRLSDGRFALAFNPTTYSEHRYPLAIVTGDDGILFNDMLCIHGEVPPRRFFGRWKDFGPQYVRGIEEGNGVPPDGAFWIAYSVNKEDMWVSRTPVPVRWEVKGAVSDNFENSEIDGLIPDWNTYSTLWAKPRVVECPGAGKCLELRDEDPYDYAKAVRVFQDGVKANISFYVRAHQLGAAPLEIEIQDCYGNRPVRLRFDEDKRIRMCGAGEIHDIQSYEPDRWKRVDISVDAAGFGAFSLNIDSAPVITNAPLAECVKSVERLVFRTGAYRDEPTRQTINELEHSPLENADEQAPLSVFQLNDVSAISTSPR